MYTALEKGWDKKVLTKLKLMVPSKLTIGSEQQIIKTAVQKRKRNTSPSGPCPELSLSVTEDL